jgi:deoxyribonuclease-4
MSIAGGLHRAFERAVRTGCDCFQVFVKNQRQWNAPPLRDNHIRAWQKMRRETGINTVIAHDTYLINLASPDRANWQKSIDAFTDEIERCGQLGIEALVTHPGSHLGRGEDWGLRRVAKALDTIHQRTKGCTVRTLLEITAGQGTNLGYRFEHLARVIDMVVEPERIGICFDTCHAFAAGYDLGTNYDVTMDQLNESIGLERLACFHLNDSKTSLGSRVDRHEHIGKGYIGRRAFRKIISDPKFLGVPMLLETPKGEDDRGRDWDRVNLSTLRRMIPHGV